MGSISTLLDETFNRGHMAIFLDTLLTRTRRDEAVYYALPNVLSPRNLVFRPDFSKRVLPCVWSIDSSPISHQLSETKKVLLCAISCMFWLFKMFLVWYVTVTFPKRL